MLTLCIALTMCSGALASRGTYTSGGVEFELTDEGYPVMSEPVTVSVVSFCTTPEGAGAWETPNEIAFFKNMKAKTNIDFTCETLTRSAWTERVQLLIAGRRRTYSSRAADANDQVRQRRLPPGVLPRDLRALTTLAYAAGHIAAPSTSPPTTAFAGAAFRLRLRGRALQNKLYINAGGFRGRRAKCLATNCALT